MKISINGVGIHVIEGGKGDTTLVFLHYWGGSARTWHHVTRALQQDFHTVALDHRGWGESERDADGYDVRTLANDAQGVIEALGISNYVLVGHSMGGKVAQFMASRRPEGLQALILVATATPGPSPIPPEQREFISHAYDSRESVVWSVENVLTARPLAAADLELVVADSLRGTPQAKRAWPTMTMMEDIQAEIAHIHVPTLIVASELDQVDPLPQMHSEVLAKMPAARMVTLPGTGHLSPLESPQELVQAIREFLGQV